MTSSASGKPSAAPRSRLILRVGVTGHRWGESFDASARPRVGAQLAAVLARSAQAVRMMLGGDEEVSDPQLPKLIAVSCLAEGGDRLFAEEALAQGWALEAVLPFPAEEYAKDFDGAASKAEFAAFMRRAEQVRMIADPRRGDDAPRAYEAAGLLMLDHTDLLIAIWDGGESRGRGGTREIVDEAVRRGMPVIWINTVKDEPAALWDGKRATPLSALDAGQERTSQFDAVLAAMSRSEAPYE